MNTREITKKIIVAGLCTLFLFFLASPLTAGSGSDREKNTATKVYPQPAGEFINLELHATSSGVYTIQLFTLSGQLVIQENILVASPGTFVYTLDASELAPGPYVMKEHDGSRRSSSTTVVIGP